MTQYQPIGAFPMPAGLLLVPESGPADLTEAVAGLMAGRLPDAWPPVLEAHRLAHAGELEAAAAAIGDDDAYARFNRFVLNPDFDDPDAVAAGLPARLAPLVAVVCFIDGQRDEPPELDGVTDAVVRAMVLACRATNSLTRARASDAIALLREASQLVADVGAPLSAILLANAATIAHEQLGDTESATTDLAAASACLAETDLAVNRAEIHYQLGAIAHEAAAPAGASLAPAMHHYYTALQLIQRDDSPFLWASAQLNLSTAYLSTPMSEATDALRMGIAIQALRAALEVFTPETHPDQWATATLNLANALVYTPSVKQGDNLVEAVELYETVLEARSRDTDPLGRARVLANQGNALAHLGIFDQAKAKLYEARFLFEEQLDHDSALTVRSILDEIVKRSLPEEGSRASGRMALAGVDVAQMRADAARAAPGD